jgi:hypothetical protein
MRQVRKKSADPVARSYLLKAKKEGLELSWNRYENMLPQDGFGKLGLTCFDCLQGPCRLNPFSLSKESTICGRNKEDLVRHNILRLLSGTVILEKDQRLTGKNTLLKAAQAKMEDLKKNNKLPERKESTKQIGLGVLTKETVNICLESVSSVVMESCLELAEEMKQEARDRGAEGFKMILVGDVTPFYPMATASNAGGVELALLTGLIDLYAVGSSGLGLGKNVIPSYHTVYRDTKPNPDKEEIRDWFIQAAVAYTKRDKEKILESKQSGEAQLLSLKLPRLKAHLEQGTFRKIGILAGGSSVLITEDALLCEAATVLAGQDVLCLTYGNAAATLGKYGLLAPGAEGASQKISQALGLEKGSPAYWLGSESEILTILDLVDVMGANNVLALVPELSTAEDLQAAFALAGRGVKVFTAIKLPVDGSKKIAQEIDELIKYCDPQDFMAQIIAEL